MPTSYLTWLLLISRLSSQAEPEPTLPAAIRQALPAGYTVLSATRGDLNRDALPDWAVVLHRPNEKQTSDVVAHPTRRPLLLFVGGVGVPTPWPPAPTTPCTVWTAGA